MVASVNPLKQTRRLVVKVGSALLVDAKSGQLRRDWLTGLVADLAALRSMGTDVTLVSSGAIALGRRKLGLSRGLLKLEESQAAAAAGQIDLAAAYSNTFAEHKVPVAQILLTLSDTEERRRYLNARNTLSALFRMGAVPVINENDTVATEEIRFGDNDRLAARVAAMISADTLVLLSDIDGLYESDPKQNPGAKKLSLVHAITSEIEGMAGTTGSDMASGGMFTKLAAARIALDAGCALAIADGRRANPIATLADVNDGTWFIGDETPQQARKRWINGTLKIEGVVRIDDGAVKALHHGKSLLPAGAIEVSGKFERGAPVAINGPDGREVARGLIAYDADDARRIAGKRSAEIEAELGYRGRAALIHRDDLSLTSRSETLPGRKESL
ncbi:MAG: glutamate 5-kinase [Rhodospirillales bacterium]|jgi:glutamate 5-kinase